MKKAKKTAARKTLTKKAASKTGLKTRAKSKAKIQVKAKATSPAKRKAARKPRFISPEDRLVESITAREGRRAVIPQSAERNSRTAVGRVASTKKILPRKVAGKKPVFPLAHSE